MVNQSDKKQVAVRIPLRQKAELEAEAEEKGVSRSEYIRSILDDRDRAGQLADRLEKREERIEELEGQLARRSQIEQKIDTLAKRVDETDEQVTPPFPVRWYRWFRSRGSS